MSEENVKSWISLAPFDPLAGVVVRRPPGKGSGYWAGAAQVTYDWGGRTFYVVYRLRRPRGEAPDRGYEIQVARSGDGVEFETIWAGRKEELGSPSIERCAVCRADSGNWILYLSYVDPADGCWRTDWTEAERPDAFQLGRARPVFKAADLGVEGVKDPFVFRVAGVYHMVLSFATSTVPATAQQLHGEQDAYNTGLIRSATGLATSCDGFAWRWEGEIFGPSADGWDKYCSRIGCVWREENAWLALYDGSADVSENYEERVGLAYSFDLRRFQRASRHRPFMTPPQGSGALRYFDVLDLPHARHFYYEMAQPDGSHDLRVHRQEK